MHLSKNCVKCWRLGINKNAHSTDGKTEKQEKQAISVPHGQCSDGPKRFSENIKGVIKLLMNQERFSGKDDM